MATMAPADRDALFDEIYEDRVAFVVDTSSSMFYKLRAVKRQLMDCVDALSGRPEAALNLVRFGGDVSQWARSTCRCSPEAAEAAKRWLAALRAESGTNSEAALLAALDDDSCDAVYLVTDGPPESSADDFLERVVRAAAGRPVHCAYLEGHARDAAAIELFYELARRTSGSLTLARFGEGGLVERVTRLYRLDRHAYRRHCRRYRRDGGGAGRGGGGGSSASPVDAGRAAEQASTADVLLPRPLLFGASPFVCHPLYGVTNAFSPPAPLLAPPVWPRRTPRVYADGAQTVLRVPCVGYRWPYVDYHYPYGWAPWAWTYSIGKRATSADRSGSRCKADASGEKRANETRSSDDDAATEDGQSEPSSDNDDDPKDTSSQTDSYPIVPGTRMTANEIATRAERQISRYETQQQNSGLESTDESEYERKYHNSMREIGALERTLEKKIRELDDSATRRGRVLDEQIRTKRSEREMLCQQLEGLQMHRQALLRLYQRPPPDGGAFERATASRDGNRSAEWERMRNTPRLLSKPSNASRSPPADGDRRETRAPWARYWRAATH